MAKTIHIQAELYLDPDDAAAAGVNTATVFETLRQLLTDRALTGRRNHLCAHSRDIDFDHQEPDWGRDA